MIIPKMGPRYRETCERNLRLHLASLQDVPLRAISPAVVREWHASALRGKGGRTSIHAVLPVPAGRNEYRCP